MDNDNPCLVYVLNQNGTGAKQENLTLLPNISETEYLWIHVQQNDPHQCTWLKQQNLFSAELIDLLLNDMPRAFSTCYQNKLIIGWYAFAAEAPIENPEFIPMQMLMSENTIITCSAGAIHGLVNLQTAIDLNQAPTSTADFLHQALCHYSKNSNMYLRTFVDLNKTLTPTKLSNAELQLLKVKHDMTPTMSLLDTLPDWIAKETQLRLQLQQELLCENTEKITLHLAYIAAIYTEKEQINIENTKNHSWRTIVVENLLGAAIWVAIVIIIYYAVIQLFG